METGEDQKTVDHVESVPRDSPSHQKLPPRNFNLQEEEEEEKETTFTHTVNISIKSLRWIEYTSHHGTHIDRGHRLRPPVG